MLGNLLGGFITILVGVNLLPAVADGTWSARYLADGVNTTNVTGAASTIVGLVPLFYSLGIMSAGVAITVSGLKNSGVM